MGSLWKKLLGGTIAAGSLAAGTAATAGTLGLAAPISTPAMMAGVGAGAGMMKGGFDEDNVEKKRKQDAFRTGFRDITGYEGQTYDDADWFGNTAAGLSLGAAAGSAIAPVAAEPSLLEGSAFEHPTWDAASTAGHGENAVRMAERGGGPQLWGEMAKKNYTLRDPGYTFY